MQVHSAPYTAISKILTWTKLCKKYLKNPFQLFWMLPSKGRHTQTQCRPHFISYCPPITSTCFGCRKSLREFEDLCFITKSRRPIGRDENGVIIYTQQMKNMYFHLSEICVRQVFPNFLACYAPLYAHHRNLLSQEQIDVLTGLAISY